MGVRGLSEIGAESAGAEWEIAERDVVQLHQPDRLVGPEVRRVVREVHR